MEYDDTEDDDSDAMQLEHETLYLQNDIPRRSNHTMLDGVKLPKPLRGYTPSVSSNAHPDVPNNPSNISPNLNSNLARAAIQNLSRAPPPRYPPQKPSDPRQNVPPQSLNRPVLPQPVSNPSEMKASSQTDFPLQGPARGFVLIQSNYPPSGRKSFSYNETIAAEIAAALKPASSTPPVKPMPGQYAKRTPTKAAPTTSSAGKKVEPPMATAPRPLFVPTRARPNERPSEPIYDDVRPNTGTGISRCQACGNNHLPGQCPLRSNPLTACPGCGYTHLHGMRICPLFWETEYLSLMLERLRNSTEDRRLVESAKDYIQGVKGDYQRRRKEPASGKK
jgi:hypothetical protein